MAEKLETDGVNQHKLISSDQAAQDDSSGACSDGLALAQGLKESNVPAVILERDPNLGPSGRWGFAMAWSAPILKFLIANDAWSRIHTTPYDLSLPVMEVGTIPMYNVANSAHPVDFSFLKRNVPSLPPTLL
ncbi:hypothetical protein MCOR25_002526 [Pyricularia grisea]|uniref:Uncharacterized protein n=1 Tax=Pyricularia grisea TaxID=148305 RepID=A0A6P8B0T4_PYRGI|nr:uncharacterized protein PgNI_06840 [Pyricularia grisea]KAI6377544.1 hypothetical protein MCOR25_002526 [Pyricularia grisea]TLD08515.1 hypothetical protein PgNI_06840 [Pyricularia grisea]